MAEPDAEEALARKRFMAINLVRLAGVTMILLGLLVASDKIDWPDWSAWLLIVIGMFDAFVFPIVLSRRWSSNQRP